MLTVLLHGFWGQPSDWTSVANKMSLAAPLWIPDLYSPGPLAPHHDIAGWCEHFFEELDERSGEAPVQAVGYSMGGRLLVNLLLQRPDRFARALVLSANPFPVERSAWEIEWREKFLHRPWEELEQDWDKQEVFLSTTKPRRRQSSVLREMLGQSLINWSPSRNVYSVSDLKRIGAHVDWAFGALDRKYMGMSEELARLPVQGKISTIDGAGHRLPFDSVDWIGYWLRGKF